MFGIKNRLKEIEKEMHLVRAQSAVLLFQKNIIYSRKDFGYLLNYLGLTGTGVEVGVRKGNFSDHLLGTWKGEKLFSIDPWKHFDDGEYIDGSNLGQKQQEEIYREASSKLGKYKSRSTIVRDISLEAVKRFENGTLDFVYLDAQHHYEAVVEDINAWFPMIRSGGVISGDDYVDIDTEENVFGVKRAVDEFVKREKLSLLLTVDGMFPSWFVIKK